MLSLPLRRFISVVRLLLLFESLKKRKEAELSLSVCEKRDGNG
jgi:hypothetical protein